MKRTTVGTLESHQLTPVGLLVRTVSGLHSPVPRNSLLRVASLAKLSNGSSLIVFEHTVTGETLTLPESIVVQVSTQPKE